MSAAVRSVLIALSLIFVGVGMYTRSTFVLFILGLFLVMLARGGWRRWRGVLLFGGVAFVRYSVMSGSKLEFGGNAAMMRSR